MRRENVILIGMPGSGKSTIGQPLATRLGIEFVDTDHVIEAGERQPLGDVLAGRTLTGFLDLEERYVLTLDRDYSVISTGGSVVYREPAMRHLHTLGTLVFLDVPLPILMQRLLDLPGRGVVIQPGQTIADLERERRPLYERHADFAVQCGDRSPDEIAQEIATRLER